MEALNGLWHSLIRVQSLHFTARGGLSSGWNGAGSGSVVVECPGPEVLLFRETGSWQPTGGQPLLFRNVFRWSRSDTQKIRLEHLRFGPEQPVYLFDLVPTGEGEWVSVSPHLCRDDCYSARLELTEHGFRLCWSVAGPSKQESIEYLYACRPSKGA